MRCSHQMAQATVIKRSGALAYKPGTVEQAPMHHVMSRSGGNGAFLIAGRNNWKVQEARALQQTVPPRSQLTSAGTVA
uniref:Uncharacterized protein n=1 Tax=Arundo donax TaxID=35708 RepID=A0A0A9CUI3_ARUDO